MGEWPPEARRARRQSDAPHTAWPASVLLLVCVVAAATSGCTASPTSSGPATISTTATTTAAATTTTTTTSTDEDNPGAPGAPTVDGTVAKPGSGRAPGASACRSGDPLANVYHPNRLQVVQSCTTVSGTVESVRHEDDGDIHFDLALDTPYAHLLTAANTTYQHGWLVVEIVPADEPGCTPGSPPKPASGSYNYGICTGADESAPAIGAHVYVTGPYVLDNDHSRWAEIHPAWAISSTLTSTPPGTVPLPTSSSTPAPSGVRIVSVTSPVSAGSFAMLAARSAPGAACTLSVILPSGAESQSEGLGPARADGSGTVTWSWQTGSRTTPGTATATVSCGSSSASAPFEIT